MRRILLTFAFYCITAGLVGLSTGCGCTSMTNQNSEGGPEICAPKTASAQTTSAGQQSQAKPPIPKTWEDWKDLFEKNFAEDEKSPEAWGLFSYGGMVGAGQYLVFSQDKGQKGKILFVGQAQNEISNQKILSDQEWQKFKNEISQADLLDHLKQPNFGINYQFYHLKKIGGKPKVIKNLTMQDPFGDKSPQQYRLVVNAFKESMPIPKKTP